MPSEPAYIVRLRDYIKAGRSLDDYLVVEREMYGSNDRATAIIYGSLVEDALLSLIKSGLRKDLSSDDRKRLFGFEGVLGTFSSKISLAYALRLIGPITNRDLGLIRFIRNCFAHSQKHLSFALPEMAAVCAELRTADLPGTRPALGPLDLAIVEKPEAKQRYLTACDNATWKMLTIGSGDAARIKSQKLDHDD